MKRTCPLCSERQIKMSTYREHTKVIQIGNRKIGGGNPILIQSMTNTKTEDVQALDLEAFAEKYSLTKRETEVFEALLNSDDSAKDLAKQLFISRAALYRHISSLNEKTGTKSRIGLIQFYYQQKNEE